MYIIIDFDITGAVVPSRSFSLRGQYFKTIDHLTKIICV